LFLKRYTQRGISYRPVSVRTSVRLPHLCIVSKRIKISSNFFSAWYRPSF